MTRVVAAVGALLITGVLLLLAVSGVSWFMNSPAIWAVARLFKTHWIGIGMPLYFLYFYFFFVYLNKKKPTAKEAAKFR